MDQIAAQLTSARSQATGHLRRWLVLIGVSVLFTVMQIRYSQDRGRLARTPNTDDACYFGDAVDRLDAIYAQGWFQLIPDYWHNPPHSPLSAYLALSGYLLFGITDWAPYVMDGVIILAMLAFVDHLMRGARIWQRVVAGVFILSMPFAPNMVIEFRPDIAWGLAAAVAVLIPLQETFVTASKRRQLGAGGWLAAALLIKPTIFPLTLATVGLSWLFATLCDRISNSQITFHRAARAWLVASVPVLVLAVPHYLIDVRGITGYIYSTLGSERALWTTPGDRWFHETYYILGPGGMLLMGIEIEVIAAVFGLEFIALMIQMRRRIDDLRRSVCLGVVALLALAVPTINQVKNPFFGAEFQILIALYCVVIARKWIGNAIGHRNVVGSALLILMTFAAVYLNRFPQALAMPGDEMAEKSNQAVDAVAQLITDRASNGGHVFVTSFGWMNRCELKYLVRRQHKFVYVNDAHHTGDLAPYREEYQWADFVVAAEPGVSEFESWLPSYKVLDQTLELVRNDPGFKQIAVIPSATGKKFFVFARPPAFGQWDLAQNLEPLEGPYPQWNLPAVRWGVSPGVSIDFSADQARTYRLTAIARSPLVDQEVSVTLDGRELTRKDFKQIDAFDRIEASFEVTPGPHEIVLHFSKSTTSNNDQRSRALLFEKLQVMPVESRP